MDALNRPLRWILPPPFILVLAMAALVVAVPPGGEFPIDDDWNYARMVRSLVERGRLEVPAWAAASLVFQAYWGGLFAKAFGFSFGALRTSTLVLAGAGVVGFYLLLRALMDSRRALLGALLLLANPLFVFLAYSFMSDVPFLALAVWSLFCYVRALRDPRPRLCWLATGSALAALAYLTRQLGLALPLAALGGLMLRGGWRAARDLRTLATVVAPLLPALLIAAVFDHQRGQLRQEPLSWTVAFWAENGPGLTGVVLSRLAGALITLGLFTLPVSLGALTGRSAVRLSAWQGRLAGALLLVLGAGFAVRCVVFGQTPLLPHLQNILNVNGFLVSSGEYDGTLPQSAVVPGAMLAIATVAALLGAGLLILAVVVACSRETTHGPASVPLLFGLLVVGLTVSYYAFFDDYLLVLLPSALLVVLSGFPAGRWRYELALAGVVILAGWSVWWERDYLQRRAALWQAAQALVEQGIPADEIDGGFEWNGWHRGEAIMAAALQQGNIDRTPRGLERYVQRQLNAKRRWTLEYAQPGGAPGGRVLAAVPYGWGQQVLAVQRY